MPIATGEEEMTAALINELCSGRQLMETKQKFREIAAAQEADTLRGVTAGALGKPVIVMPAHEYFLIRAKYGEEAMHDRGFLRDFQKFHPEMSPNSL
jgi:rRNA maturation protein Rpf1